MFVEDGTSSWMLQTPKPNIDTVVDVSAQPKPEPHSANALAEDIDALVPLDDWLALVAGDEPVNLPRPAARYLEEVREAGET